MARRYNEYMCRPCNRAANQKGKHRGHRCDGSPFRNVMQCACSCNEWTSDERREFEQRVAIMSVLDGD